MAQTPLIHYALDGNGDDSGAGAVHATASGAMPTYDPDSNANSAYSFGSAFDKLEVSDTAAFNFGVHGDITVSAWFRTTSTSAYKTILMCGTGAWASGYLLGVNWETNKLMFGIGCEGFSNMADVFAIATVADVNDGLWHHAVVSVSGTDNVARLYLDGQPAKVTLYDAFGQPGGVLSADSTEVDITGVDYKLIPSTSSFMIGNSAWSQYFSGDIDDVRIYGEGLSASEVAGLYSGNPTALAENARTRATHSLYPNPATHRFEIAGEHTGWSARIFDATGKLVSPSAPLSSPLTAPSASGLYHVVLTSGNRVESLSLLVP